MKKYKTKNMNLQLFADNPTPCYFMWDTLANGTYHVKPFTIYGVFYSNGNYNRTITVLVNYITISNYGSNKNILFDQYQTSVNNVYRATIKDVPVSPNTSNFLELNMSYKISGGYSVTTFGQIYSKNYPKKLTTYEVNPNPTGTSGFWYVDGNINILDYSTNQPVCGMKLVESLGKKILKLNNKTVGKFNNKNINTFNNIEIMSGRDNFIDLEEPILYFSGQTELNISTDDDNIQFYDIYINDNKITTIDKGN